MIENSRRCSFGYDQRVEVFGAGGSISGANRSPQNVLVNTEEGLNAGGCGCVCVCQGVWASPGVQSCRVVSDRVVCSSGAAAEACSPLRRSRVLCCAVQEPSACRRLLTVCVVVVVGVVVVVIVVVPADAVFWLFGSHSVSIQQYSMSLAGETSLTNIEEGIQTELTTGVGDPQTRNFESVSFLYLFAQRLPAPH